MHLSGAYAFSSAAIWSCRFLGPAFSVASQQNTKHGTELTCIYMFCIVENVVYLQCTGYSNFMHFQCSHLNNEISQTQSLLVYYYTRYTVTISMRRMQPSD